MDSDSQEQSDLSAFKDILGDLVDKDEAAYSPDKWSEITPEYVQRLADIARINSTTSNMFGPSVMMIALKAIALGAANPESIATAAMFVGIPYGNEALMPFLLRENPDQDPDGSE